MSFAQPISAATEAGKKLPEVAEPFVEPPETRAWKGTADDGNELGMAAARAAEGSRNDVDSRYIDAAVVLAPLAVFALSLLVLDPVTKYNVVSAQIEWGNGNRTYALLSSAALLRALACVTACRGAYDTCDALHQIFWYIFGDMDKAKPGISKGRAVQIVFSVTLFFAESIFEGNSDALSVIESIRRVLGATALCAFACEQEL